MSVAPVVAIIVNEQTPYRLHLHRRIVREMPEIQLWSLFTHELASSPWRYRDVQEINPVLFGAGQSTAGHGSLRNALREWHKGGDIIQWLQSHAVRAVVLFGYNDLARLRIARDCHARRLPCFLFGDSNVLADTSTGLRATVKHAYVSWFIRRCAGVMHCGRLGRQYFLKYGTNPERLYPFPYEPDYDLVATPDPTVVDRTVDRFGLAPHRRRLLFVGRVTRAKRPDLLIEAFDRIAEKRPTWDLVIAGDGDLAPALKKLPASTRRAGRICWAGFLDDPSQLAALYSVSDVLVLPSDFEPWGVVVTEAATRLALVTSSVVGAAADVLDDGRNGRSFPAGDLDGLTRALLEVTDPDHIDRMKSASPQVLARWRAQSDPVQHLRQALYNCGVLSQ